MTAIDPFGRMPCPGCGELITVITHVDKPGSRSGVTTIDIDLDPMSWHIAGCDGTPKENPRG